MPCKKMTCLVGNFRRLISSAILPIALLLHRTDYATGQQNVTVAMKPLRYCSDKRWWGCWKHSYPYGDYWDAAGMSGANQDSAFMAVMGEEPASPRYIAIFSHGQQGLTGAIESSSQNVVCGSDAGWKWCTDENGSQEKSVDGRSVAAQFYSDQSRFLPQSDTLYLTIWDGQFDHMDSENTKDEILQGYAAFLDSKVESWANIEGIVMVGASRGGCLVMRLAQKLQSEYTVPNTKFAMSTIDPVCKMTQHEFGVTSETIENPINSAYKSYKTDIAAQFSSGSKSNYCIRNLALGNEVSKVSLEVRGFSHSTCSASLCHLYDSTNSPYFTQEWADMCHSCAGRQFDPESLAITVEPILSHLEGCMARFEW